MINFARETRDPFSSARLGWMGPGSRHRDAVIPDGEPKVRLRASATRYGEPIRDPCTPIPSAIRQRWVSACGLARDDTRCKAARFTANDFCGTFDRICDILW